MLSAIAHRRFSFGAHLAAFALLVTLPVAALSLLLLLRSADMVRDKAEARLLQLAHDLSDDIDRDVERHILVLNTLSTLPSFRAGDWAAFHTQATTALRGDGYIVLIDSSFRQLANTYVAFGRAPARTGDLETAQRIVASRRPEVSNVFTSLVTGGPVINFDTPILRDGQVGYILIYARPVEYVSGILAGQGLETGWAGSVFDRNGALIGGSAAAAPPAQMLTPGTSVLTRHADSSGAAILRATHVSELTGWTVAVDVPLAVVSGEIDRSLQWSVLIATAALLLAIGLGVVFGQFLSSQLRRASAYAVAMGREEAPPDIGSTTLQEVDTITQSLQNARAELDRRMAKQRLLSRELSHRVKNVLSVVQAVVRLSLPGGDTTARDVVLLRLRALGRSHDLLTHAEWTDLPLRRIVETEVTSFAERVACDGPDILVRAAHVQNMGLILHELATNALKYGALRDGSGTISVNWAVGGEAGDKRFTFVWKEHATPAPGADVRRSGFGSTLLRNTFTSADCRHRLDIEPDGLIYELDLPLDLVIASGEAS
ncbi:MAG: sensor histidine kinase [Hyphomonadaceae bacterium]